MESDLFHVALHELQALAAQTHDPLVRWMDNSGVLDMADLSGIALHY